MSYAQADREQARPLADFLRASGYTVWWDVGLRPGDNFTTEIQHQIQKADHFIVVWSRRSVASFWVTAETTYARTCGKPILPLRIDECLPPVPFNLLQTTTLRTIKQDGPDIIATLVNAGTLPAATKTQSLSNRAVIAEEVVRKAQELARWEFIKGSDQAADFRTFLARFPDGELADLAIMRLESLRWATITNARTIESLTAFLVDFPNGVKAPEARRCLERKQRAIEAETWSRLRGGWLAPSRKRPDKMLSEYVAFLAAHPTGVHAEQAQAIVDRLRAEVETWHAASVSWSKDAVLRYLREFPRGGFVSEAKASLARLEWRHKSSRTEPAEDTSTSNANANESSFPIVTFASLAIAAFLLGCLGAHLGVRGQFLVTLPFRSVSGDIYYFLHPYPIFIGIFIAVLIHEWGNRSWLTTLFAFTAILAFRSVSQLLGVVEDDTGSFPIQSMIIGALYCFGAWVAGLIVAPYMRKSPIVFVVSILLGAVTYPDWALVFGMPFVGHEILNAGVFFVACTSPIAYSLLRATRDSNAPEKSTEEAKQSMRKPAQI